MRPGWRTSELTFATLCGAAAFQLALTCPEESGPGLARLGACLALGWLGAAYCRSRGAVKGKAG